jgi:hypothetical protein
VKNTIRVRAGDGLSIPLPSGQAIDTTLTVITPETPVEVLLNRYTRRRLACGDFVEVQTLEATEPAPPTVAEDEDEDANAVAVSRPYEPRPPLPLPSPWSDDEKDEE